MRVGHTDSESAPTFLPRKNSQFFFLCSWRDSNLCPLDPSPTLYQLSHPITHQHTPTPAKPSTHTFIQILSFSHTHSILLTHTHPVLVVLSELVHTLLDDVAAMLHRHKGQQLSHAAHHDVSHHIVRHACPEILATKLGLCVMLTYVVSILYRDRERKKERMYIYLFIGGLQPSQPQRVTSGLFTQLNLTEVENDTKQAYFTNVKKERKNIHGFHPLQRQRERETKNNNMVSIFYIDRTQTKREKDSIEWDLYWFLFGIQPLSADCLNIILGKPLSSATKKEWKLNGKFRVVCNTVQHPSSKTF